jgi:sodium-dependent dicarboxylate transporter 2/3/5
MTEGEPHGASTPRQRLGFWLGVSLAGVALVAAERLSGAGGLTAAEWRLLAVTALVATWWITEALPLGATALVPIAAFPLLGISSSKQVATAYGDPVVLLLLGGFFLALSVESSGVHRRIALHVLLAIGVSPPRLVLGFFAASAAVSMWISNTATTLILAPVALAIAERAEASDPARARGFVAAVLLAVAYGASIGGMGTPVGTPPNLIALGALARQFPEAPPVTFVAWARSALPVVLLLVPLGWLILVRVAPKVPADLQLGARALLRDELAALGPWRSEERRALAVFGAAALAWITRPDLQLGAVTVRGWASLLGVKGADDGTVAMLCALVAFALPQGRGSPERLLSWRAVGRVPWGLVLLFGGGMALSEGFVATGLSERLGLALGQLAGGSPLLFVAALVPAVIFASELMSNTALANLMLPILAAAASNAGLEPGGLVISGALACSAGFMLPAATGPNAIVFGTGRVTVGTMARAGLWLDVASWGVIVGAALLSGAR